MVRTWPCPKPLGATCNETRLAVTKADLWAETAGLRSDMADLRTELKTDIAELRAEMAELRSETTAQIGALRTSMANWMLTLLVAIIAAMAGISFIA